MYLFDYIVETQYSWNPHIDKCELLKTEDGYNIYLTQIKPPAVFISGRVFVDCRYIIRNQEKREYFAMFSSNGNELIRQEYLNTHDCNGAQAAHCGISGHWFRPLMNERNEVIGTKVFYLNESDFGGHVPQWIARSFAPKAVLDTYENITNAARNIKL